MCGPTIRNMIHTRNTIILLVPYRFSGFFGDFGIFGTRKTNTSTDREKEQTTPACLLPTTDSMNHNAPFQQTARGGMKHRRYAGA